MEFVQGLKDVGIITYTLTLFVISITSYYTSLKMINKFEKMIFKKISLYLKIILISVLCGCIKYFLNLFVSIILLVILLSVILLKSNKNNVIYSVLTVVISLSINYIIYIASTIISIIPIIAFKATNIYSSFLIIIIIYLMIMKLIMRIRKLKKGFIFLQDQDEYFGLLLLNVSMIILFLVVGLNNYQKYITSKIGIFLILFAIAMFFTIQRSLQLYYKQKLLVKELDETKAELANKEKEVKDLEAENIAISKKSHTLSHKQKALEYKLEEIINKAEISKEEVGEVTDRIKAIEKDLYKEKTTTELDKTEIPQIDNMLKYMQSECEKNKIDFELQIKGNIHYMTNNLITKDDLETLLADHIKNAIIAINHTNNINRSILVRLGEIDGIYSLYIYDSGIEFNKETLENLGKKPSTTHADEGGTGMGFMNTFDTLRKCNASLTIEEFNEPSKDNYTKAIIIKFDKKNEFKIISYRQIVESEGEN